MRTEAGPQSQGVWPPGPCWGGGVRRPPRPHADLGRSLSQVRQLVDPGPGMEPRPADPQPRLRLPPQLLPYKEGQHPQMCEPSVALPHHHPWPEVREGAASAPGVPAQPPTGQSPREEGRTPLSVLQQGHSCSLSPILALTEGQPVCDPTVHLTHQSHGSDPSRPLTAAPTLSHSSAGEPRLRNNLTSVGSGGRRLGLAVPASTGRRGEGAPCLSDKGLGQGWLCPRRPTGPLGGAGCPASVRSRGRRTQDSLRHHLEVCVCFWDRIWETGNHAGLCIKGCG